MPTTTTVDVSKWQDPEALDWNGLKANGLKSAIIQLSYGSEQEPKADTFLEKVRNEGLIPHGYHFYEGSTSEFGFAVQNAKNLGLKKGAYLFLDMEGSISGDWASQFEQFRTTVTSAGYKAGLYVSDSPYKSRFDDKKLTSEGVARWVASYSYEPANYDIWQFSDGSGKLDHDYDRAGILAVDYETPVNPVTPTNNPVTPSNPVTPGKDGIRPYVLDWVTDSVSGVLGKGCSYDGGKTYKVYWTMWGRKYYSEDAERLWPFFSPLFGKYVDQKIADIQLTPGPQGPKGDTGSPGKDGANGVNGKDGSPGKDGKSAYQIAVDNGFVGSEAEWLQSLHGKDGASSSGGDASLSIEAITELIKDHIHATVDTTSGQLTVSTDDVSNGSIADTVAAKVVSSMSWKLSTDGELIAEVGGE